MAYFGLPGFPGMALEYLTVFPATYNYYPGFQDHVHGLAASDWQIAGSNFGEAGFTTFREPVGSGKAGFTINDTVPGPQR